jgi:hypothetical protein
LLEAGLELGKPLLGLGRDSLDDGWGDRCPFPRGLGLLTPRIKLFAERGECLGMHLTLGVSVEAELVKLGTKGVKLLGQIFAARPLGLGLLSERFVLFDQSGELGLMGLIGLPLGVVALFVERGEAIPIEGEIIAALEGGVTLTAQRIEFLAELGQVLEMGGALPVEFALRGLEPLLPVASLAREAFVLSGDRFELERGLVALVFQGFDLIL